MAARLVIILFLLTGLLLASPVVAFAAPAHCSPNAILTSTHYSNYDQLDDSYVNFAFDIDDQPANVDGSPLCYQPDSGQTIAISLIARSDVYTNLNERVAGPSDPDTSVYDHQIHGVNWGAAAIATATTDAWVSFYVELRLRRVGRPGLVELALYSTKGGVGTNQFEPLDNGDELGRGVFNGDTLPTAFPSVAYSPRVRIHWDSGVILASGASNYALTVRATSGDINNRVEWRTSTAASDTGSNNYGSETTDSGTTWATMNAEDTYPWIRTYGADLVTIDNNDILASYQWEDEPTSGTGAGSLYFPLALNSTDYGEITNYALIIWDIATTQPDAIYRLGNACLVVLEDLPSKFHLDSIAASIGANTNPGIAASIPILNLLMGERSSGSNLAVSLGLGVVPAFLLVTIAFSFAAMLVIARFTTHYMIIMLAGMIPPVVMTMQGLLPVIVLTSLGSFVVLTLLWQAMVKRNV